jgi:hypothetical protein
VANSTFPPSAVRDGSTAIPIPDDQLPEVLDAIRGDHKLPAGPPTMMPVFKTTLAEMKDQ